MCGSIYDIYDIYDIYIWGKRFIYHNKLASLAQTRCQSQHLSLSLDSLFLHAVFFSSVCVRNRQVVLCAQRTTLDLIRARVSPHPWLDMFDSIYVQNLKRRIPARQWENSQSLTSLPDDATLLLPDLLNVRDPNQNKQLVVRHSQST